ncbi:MAG: M24 family metallopeptidase [bacterium]
MEAKVTSLPCGLWSIICDHNYKKRRDRLKEKLEEKTGYYTSYLSNIRYLTGFRGTAGVLVISPGKSCLLVDGRYRHYVESLALQEIEIITYRKTRLKALNDWLEKCPIDKLMFERSNLSYAEFRKIVNNIAVEKRGYGKNLVSELRIIKEESELQLLRKAAQKTETVFDELGEWLEPGTSENEINRFLRSRLEEKGEARSFYPLTLIDERTAMPHAPPADKVIKEDGSLLVDIGVNYGGYCADLTRMYFLRENNDKLKELYRLAKKAAHRAFCTLAPGVPVEEVNRAAHELIVGEESQDCIRHGAGHGLGLEIHEPPALKKNSRRTLAANMVVTLEPGIYVDGVGGARVEHMARVTESGAELIDKPNGKFEKELYK